MASIRVMQCSLLFLLALAGGECAEDNKYEWSVQAGTWLKYHAEPATWEDARLQCHSEDAILASPLTYKMKEALETLVDRQKSSANEQEIDTIFIGVHATFSRGDYSSIEGVPLARLAIAWARGEPDNVGNSERCLEMSILGCHGTMADTRCDKKLPYVCYKHSKHPKKVYRFDYDWVEQARGWLKYNAVPSTRSDAKMRCHAEGGVVAYPYIGEMWKAIERFVLNQIGRVEEQGITIFAGVDETIKESDRSQRCLAMTLRRNELTSMSDTSCNRVLPYVCYKEDFNVILNECGTTDPEYVLQAETGSCYKFHNIGLVWSEAYMTCVAEGGYLAIINNDTEAAVIKKIIYNHPEDKIDAVLTYVLNVGFQDWGHFGTNFMTIHGELKLPVFFIILDTSTAKQRPPPKIITLNDNPPLASTGVTRNSLDFVGSSGRPTYVAPSSSWSPL